MNVLSNIDEEWVKFNEYIIDDDDDEEVEAIDNNDVIMSANITEGGENIVPVISDLYISTKSKIAFLNQTIDLKKIFWGLEVIPYASPKNGVIKKQMKFNSFVPEELEEIQTKLKNEQFFEEHIITSINNPTGRIKFKDIRKVSVGISKKDLISYRTKKKSAFYNCFVMILRMKVNDTFKEFHVKVFNTGKMEMPGVQNDNIFNELLNTIISILQPFTEEPLSYLQKSDTVLVNSNFNCGFYIHREIFYELLKSKYNIQCIYDPCSYPGIQCKYYYYRDSDVQTGSQKKSENTIGANKKDKNIVEVSFMIFRTGSILIVGMCDDNVLYSIYEFLKKILTVEFPKIHQNIISGDALLLQKKKVRRKTIMMNCA